MARIAGIDIPREKRIEVALTYIYGIGVTTSKRMLQLSGISPDVRVKDLSDSQVSKLRDVIGKQLQGRLGFTGCFIFCSAAGLRRNRLAEHGRHTHPLIVISGGTSVNPERRRCRVRSWFK